MGLFSSNEVQVIDEDKSEIRLILIEQFHQLKNIESEMNDLKGIHLHIHQKSTSPSIANHYHDVSNALRNHIKKSNKYCVITKLPPVFMPLELNSITIADLSEKIHGRIAQCESLLLKLR